MASFHNFLLQNYATQAFQQRIQYKNLYSFNTTSVCKHQHGCILTLLEHKQPHVYQENLFFVQRLYAKQPNWKPLS